MENPNPKKRKRTVVKNAPPINCLQDLINISNEICFYKNIDMIVLWKINPYMRELNNMVGLEELKETIYYQIIYYIQGMHLKNKEEEYLHSVILGPPGSGKTTVAKIISKIYQCMGILSPDSPFKIGRRDDFIAGYLGQTAIKTQKFLESCLGGVLFIDEVYSLGPGKDGKDSFSKEAVDVLCNFLSEHTHDFCCIAAGYENDVYNRFFSLNKGLESRFQWRHRINEYNIENLIEIFKLKIDKIGWKLNIKNKKLETIFKSQEKDTFKHAGRDIGNLISKCKMSHSKRVLSLDKNKKYILSNEDIEEGIKMYKKFKTKIEKKSFTDHLYM